MWPIEYVVGSFLFKETNAGSRGSMDYVNRKLPFALCCVVPGAVAGVSLGQGSGNGKVRWRWKGETVG